MPELNKRSGFDPTETLDKIGEPDLGAGRYIRHRRGARVACDAAASFWLAIPAAPNGFVISARP